jgi:hypothetical protein
MARQTTAPTAPPPKERSKAGNKAEKEASWRLAEARGEVKTAAVECKRSA